MKFRAILNSQILKFIEIFSKHIHSNGLLYHLPEKKKIRLLLDFHSFYMRISGEV